MGPENHETSMSSLSSNLEIVPLPDDSPFLSDHDARADTHGIPRTPASPPDGVSQFPPSHGSQPSTAGFAVPDPGRAAYAAPPGYPPQAATYPPGYLPPGYPPPGYPPQQGGYPPPPGYPPFGGYAAPASGFPAHQAPPPDGGGNRIILDSLSSFSIYPATEDPFARPPGPGNSPSSERILPPPSSVPPPADLAGQLKAIVLTSTDSLQGRMVDSYLAPVSAYVLVPRDFVFEGSEPGGRFQRHKNAQVRLRQLEQLAAMELRLEAHKLGADGILRYKSDLSWGDVVCVTVSGTAVRLA